MPDSSIPKFFEKSRDDRLDVVGKFSNLTPQEIDTLRNDTGGLTFIAANNMVENAIGTFSLPLGIATNFCVNGVDYLIPMVIEEPSVIAAASSAAKIAKIHGGFKVFANESFSIGQIQVLNYTDVDIIDSHKQEILQIANAQSNTLSKINKGAKQVTHREIQTDMGPMLIVELLIDVGDAMGANITNSMCEAVSPLIQDITHGTALLRILSNYSTRRLVKVNATFDKDAIGGSKVVDDIILASQFAIHDVYRAVTHNKGIMNGVIAVSNATGQDSRAIEAAANAYACKDSRYTSLSSWSKDSSGNLVGSLEMPMSVGIVGGIVQVHPMAKICKKILGVSSALELGGVIVSAGLAQNFAAIRALSTDGIQKGHMKLHARNLAISAGAKSDLVDDITLQMIKEGNISLNRAKELLGQS